MADPQFFTEIFPILSEQLPPITAYRLVLQDRVDPARRPELERKMGGKLTYRLRTALGGPWAWLNGRILTGTTHNPVQLLMAVDEARRDGGSLYRELDSLAEDYSWSATPELLSEYAARALAEPLLPEIQTALAAITLPLKGASVERDVRVRSWVVDGQPALSLSVVSRLVFTDGFSAWAATLDQITGLIGMSVSDKTGGLQGEIIKVTGTLAEHRARLLGLTQREEMAELLRASPDETWVVRVLSGGNEYDYSITALNLLVRPQEAARFDVNAAHAERALHMKPALRASVIKTASDILKAHGLIGPAYSTQNSPSLFYVFKPEVAVLLGGGKSRPYVVERTPIDFRQAGPYYANGSANTDLRITLINALDDTVDDFVEVLRRTLERDYHQNLVVVRERKLRVSSQANLESAVRMLSKEDARLMLVFLPNEPADDSGEAVSATYAKAQTIGRGQPCLVVHESTMHKPEALQSIILGLIARRGVVPYIFEEPLAFADRVVGLSLIRQSRKNKDRLTGISRVYKSDGGLLGYVVAEADVGEHEGVPDALLTALLPDQWLAGKRVVLHVHGKLRRDETRSLGAREADLDATFLTVEVSGRFVPRLYALDNGRIGAPTWGTAMRLSPHEAILLTSSAPGDATPQPLHVQIDPDAPAGFTLDQAMQSLVAFTTLHYGVLQLPRLPVTLHHADLIAASAERGVLPVPAEGTTPFWL